MASAFNKILGGLAWVVVFYLLNTVIPIMGYNPEAPSASQLILSKIFFWLALVMVAYTASSVIETIFKKK